ncbi:GTP-binding protein [Amycolatopsis sp. NPDC054798]
MNDDIIEQLIRAGGRPAPRRPAHLRVDAAQLRARLASKPPEQLARLVEYTRKVHADLVTASSHDGPEQHPAPPSPDRGTRSRQLPHPAVKPFRDKIVVAGGSGAGKSAFVAAISTEMLSTGENPERSQADLGKLVLSAEVSLRLFGMPDPFRATAEYEAIAENALGGIVLVDSGRLADAFPHIDYLESHGIPYVVAVTMIGGPVRRTIEEVRQLLVLKQTVPIEQCDARVPQSARRVLAALIDEATRTHCSPGQSVPEELRLAADRILA